MLGQVLEEFEKARAPTRLDLMATRLGVQRSALVEMVRFLVRKGRLKEAGSAGVPACPGCSSGCGSGAQCALGIQAWTLAGRP